MPEEAGDCPIKHILELQAKERRRDPSKLTDEHAASEM